MINSLYICFYTGQQYVIVLLHFCSSYQAVQVSSCSQEKKITVSPLHPFFLRVGKWFIKRLTPVYFILLLFPISGPRDCGSEFGLNLLSRKSDKILPIKNQQFYSIVFLKVFVCWRIGCLCKFEVVKKSNSPSISVRGPTEIW